MTETGIVTLYITCNDREQALGIAHELLVQKLIACANILDNVTSLYHWQGEIQQDKEVLLLAKTTIAKSQAAIAAARKAHSHEIPCITLLPVNGGNSDYLAWVKKEVS